MPFSAPPRPEGPRPPERAVRVARFLGRSAIPFHRSVRLRMLLIALIPLLVVLPILLAVAGAGWLKRFDELTVAKVASDLTVARQQLDGLMQGATAGLSALARSVEFHDAQDDPAALARLLEAERVRLNLDALIWIGPAAQDDPARTAMLEAPVVREALEGRAGAAMELFAPDRLAALSPALQERARIRLSPTEGAVPTGRAVEDRGLMALAAAPAGDGALAGAILLNRNLDFIDRINELVYSDAGLVAGSVGTATIFLDDVRVSTNVRLFEGERALGTRVSREVRRAVLEQGRRWLDRAFVVNDWYNSAYQPLTDGRGARIGMLYVGFLDAPYAAARRRTLMAAAGVFAAALAVGAPVLLWWARGIFKPLERVSRVIARVEAGDLSARSGIGASGAGDEIARAAAHIDHLLDVVEEREARLRGWNEALEASVAERTADLREANRRLEEATRQLIVSEKLAAIGEITAGVAHEINNPLAVMQGNLEVILDDLGGRAGPLSTEFGLIQQQIQRVHVLVSKLLQFSRPEEYADAPMGHAPAAAMEEALRLVDHLLARSGVRVETDFAAAGLVGMNRAELQQVLVNLMINAIQAMPEGGVLRLETADLPGDAPRVAVTVADDGRGMAAEVLARAFDPFFTTRHGEGTGLGLSISRKLAERAGGRLSAASAPGEGARFTLELPAAG